MQGCSEDDKSARAAENQLVRRRIQNARILARMQEEGDARKQDPDDPESDEDLPETDNQRMLSDDEEVDKICRDNPESQESGVGTGT